jgi:hypothetical protein
MNSISIIYEAQTVESPCPEFPMIPSAANLSNNTNVTSRGSTSQMPPSFMSHGVRITLRQGPTSSCGYYSENIGDNTISDCHVNVIVNDVKPLKMLQQLVLADQMIIQIGKLNLLPNTLLLNKAKIK